MLFQTTDVFLFDMFLLVLGRIIMMITIIKQHNENDNDNRNNNDNNDNVNDSFVMINCTIQRIVS